MRDIDQSSQKTWSLRSLGAGCREKHTVISRSNITWCVFVLDFANVAQNTEQDFCADLTPRSSAGVICLAIKLSELEVGNYTPC